MFKLIILLSCINFAFSIEQTPEVKVSQGIVRGVKQQTIWGKHFNSFNGIPFAKPPIGKLRFKAPVPAEPWIGIWNATDVANACSQALLVDHFEYAGDEDCLYVNVHTPELPHKNSKLKDVLVYIHGGGFQVLSGDQYGAEYILERDIVFVTFNYRLGPFGFLSLEDDVLPGNNGLWDQNLALKWVKKNIASFGGDPQKITIAGMSAGGASVHYHLLSKRSKGLFQKAIASSGAVLNPWAIAEKPREYAIKVAANLGCPDGSSEEILKCVKQRPAKNILVATHKLRDYGMLPIAPIGPIIEKPSSKAFIDKQPYDIIIDGEMNDVPTLWTVNSEEGLFPGAVVVQDESGIVEQNWDKLLPSILEFQNTAKTNQVVQIAHQIREHYLGGKPMRENVEGVIKIFGDRLFYNGIYDAIEAHVEHGKAPIHAYQFSYIGEKRLSDSTGLHKLYKGGACHGDDNHYVLRAKYMPMEGNTKAEKMINTVTDLWMEFIEGSPSWEPVKPGALKYLDVVCTDPANNKVKTVSRTSGQLLWKSFGLAENRGELIEPDNRHNEL